MNGPIETFALSYTYARPFPGALIFGRWEAGALASPVTFRAVIQPLRGLELMILPEGQRTKATIIIFTDEALQVADPATNVKGDWVSYEGKTWEVQRREDWTSTPQPLAHYKFFAQLVEADTRS